MGALFFDADSNYGADIYVTSGSNEFGAGSVSYRDRWCRNHGDGKFKNNTGKVLPESLVSSHCASAVDFDHNGDLDLFLGPEVCQATTL